MHLYKFLFRMKESANKYKLTISGKYFNEISVLNASSRDLNMSRIDFHDDKLSLEMDRINQVLMKFENLS